MKTTDKKPAAKKSAKAAPAKKAAPKTPASKRTDNKKFPGYPKYAASEDITANATRVDQNLDDEVLTQVKHNKNVKAASEESIDEETVPAPKNQYDVNKEDLEALGPKDLSLDMGDDEDLKHRTTPVDFAGKDLDVPGTELDDESEEIGSEDEENNEYSLGADKKD